MSDLIQLNGDVDTSAQNFRNIANNLNDNGKLNLELNSVPENIKTSLRIAGFTNINIDGNTVTAEKKPKVNKANNENPWKMIKLEERSDLILEDELIDPYDKFQKFSKASDCITKPKPCKNCNCGRAKENQTESEVKDFKPECGKCYLGDAFRCAGCPYRGKPAFEPGDKITIDNTTDDVIQSDTSNTVKVSGNKITLDI